MDLKQKYKLDPPGMEDMLIAVWATAACPEYIETGIPKLDESPDMPANTNTLTGRLESWNSMELDKWVTFKYIGWYPPNIFVITIIHLDFFYNYHPAGILVIINYYDPPGMEAP